MPTTTPIEQPFKLTPPSNRIGYRFYIDGLFCKKLDHRNHDPKNETWEPFLMEQLHPMGKASITIEIPRIASEEEGRKECIHRAVVICEWFRQLRGWEGFDASLWLDHGRLGSRRVHRWELV